MATSGSIDLSLTAQEIITYALRLINICAQTEEPSADDAERGRVELNMMLKDWMRYEHIWRVKEGYVNIVADEDGYSLTPRPHRIHEVRYGYGRYWIRLMRPHRKPCASPISAGLKMWTRSLRTWTSHKPIWELLATISPL